MTADPPDTRPDAAAHPPVWAHLPGARALVAATLQDGRFSVRLDDGHFECLLQRQPGPCLFVMLSGPRPADAGSDPFFERVNWAQRLPGSLLCVADPLLAVDGSRLRVGWYVGTAARHWQMRLAGLVRTIADKLGIPTQRVICCGSTSGGFAALMLAAHLKDATALAINPHTQVLKCPRALVDDLLHGGFGGRAASALEPEERVRLSAITAFRRAPGARCLLVQNLGDTALADAHFRPFCEALGIPAAGGTDDAGLRSAMVYEQPVGNRREPGHLVAAMLAAALRLTQRAGPQPAAAAAPATPARITAAQLYLINNRHQVKDKATIDFVPRQDLRAFPIRLPLDWNADPFTDRNWCAQLHMWRMMDNHLLEFERTSDAQWLVLPLAIIDDWYDYHVTRRRTSRFAWMDMMVGMRAMKLAYLLSAHGAGVIQLSAVQLRAYEEMVELHLKFLLDIGNIAYSNHTFIDMHGLAALGAVSRGPRRTRIREFLKEVVPRLLASQFDPSGVHLENSTGYQAFGIGCLKRLAATGWFEEYGVGELLRRARQVDEWFRLPDGRCVPIGDTDGAAMTGEPATAFSARRELINACGYVIYRDDGEGRCDQASYLFLMAAFNSRFHKQNDDLSFTWFEGEDILCDAGKFAYKSGEMQQYVQSARAHNTLEFDGRNVADNLSRRPDLAYGSAVRQAQPTDWGCVITAQVHHRTIDVVHTRHLVHADKRWVLVIDRVAADRVHDCVQWLHFSPHLELAAEGRLHFRSRLRSGRALDVRAAAPAALDSTCIKGQVEPQRQGWISQAYGQLTPCHTLGLAQRGQNVRFATLLSIDDAGSTLSWLGDDVVEAHVRWSAGVQHLRIELHDQSCTVSCQPEAVAAV